MEDFWRHPDRPRDPRANKGIRRPSDCSDDRRFNSLVIVTVSVSVRSLATKVASRGMYAWARSKCNRKSGQGVEAQIETVTGLPLCIQTITPGVIEARAEIRRMSSPHSSRRGVHKGDNE